MAYVVYMDCKVKKAVVCDNCTEEQARNQPWEFAVDEDDIDMVDWVVTRVEED